MSTVATKVRIATAASAIAAAATLAPAAVAYASPAAPLPTAALGSTLGGDTVAACDPVASVCAPQVAAAVGDPSTAAIIEAPPFFWFGSPANPNFEPLVGIIFPNVFGLDFEACAFGGAVHLSPYSGGFIGIGRGC
jgi:hypothetical protein